jgi:hypothetical protein
MKISLVLKLFEILLTKQDFTIAAAAATLSKTTLSRMTF